MSLKNQSICSQKQNISRQKQDAMQILMCIYDANIEKLAEIRDTVVIEKRAQWDVRIAQLAVASDSPVVLDWVHDLPGSGCWPRNWKLPAIAGYHGHVECLKVLWKRCYFMPDAVMDSAAIRGHVNVLDWLLRSCRMYPDSNVYEYAQLFDHKHVKEWLAQLVK